MLRPLHFLTLMLLLALSGAIEAQQLFAVSPQTRWNELDHDPGITLSNGNLTAKSSNKTSPANCFGLGNGFCAIRSTNGVPASGTKKLFYEVTVTNLGASLQDQSVGIASELFPVTGHHIGGTTSWSVGFVSDGTVTKGDFAVTTASAAWASGVVVDVAIDTTTTPSLGWFRANGGNWNGDPTSDPTQGLSDCCGIVMCCGTARPGGSHGGILGNYFFPAISGSNDNIVSGGGTQTTFVANFGATPYSFAAPAGFGNW